MSRCTIALASGLFILTMSPLLAAEPAEPDGKSPKAEATKKTGFVQRTQMLADGSQADYMLFVPHNYNEVKEVAVILFLHGAGETKGGANEPVDVGIGPYIRQHARAFPFLTIIPQAQEEGWAANREMVMAILDRTLANYKADPQRVYLTGLSMGGIGTWNYAAREPDRWAAIVPICGTAKPDKAESIKDIPCWAFHGAADDVIDVSGSRDMIAALKQAGGNPNYTEYPRLGHACWNRAYSTPELWTWLASQRRK